MDVVYAVVEGVHIFVPVIAIAFLLIIVYFSSSKNEDDEDFESSENATFTVFLIMKAADCCSLLYAEQRLKSFKKWPFDAKSAKTKTQNFCTSVNLAKAGYIFFEGSCATCVFCGKTLEFEPQDNPYIEHRSHSPNCVFIEMMEKSEIEWTVKEIETLIAALSTQECLKIVKRWQEELHVQGRKVLKRIEPYIEDNN